MKTTVLKPAEVEKKWYIIDAAGQAPGRIATTIANKLRGKDKPTFAPHMDCGDFVIVINAEKIKLSGNKLEGKMYYRHSGFPGGFKEMKAKDMLEKKPTKIMELAISGMLPKNKLRQVFMSKCKIYAGEEHPHAAQNPETLTV